MYFSLNCATICKAALQNDVKNYKSQNPFGVFFFFFCFVNLHMTVSVYTGLSQNHFGPDQRLFTCSHLELVEVFTRLET